MMSAELVPNLATLVGSQAAARPDAVALKVPQGRTGKAARRFSVYTFKQLAQEIDTGATWLQLAGIERGMLVLVLVPPGIDLFRVVFGLFHLGAVPVVIDPGMGLERFLASVRQIQPGAVVGVRRAMWVRKLFGKSFASVRVTVEVGTPKAEQAIAAARKAPKPPRAQVHADELAAVLFTSGSTGPAKGVRYTLGNFAAQITLLQDHLGIEPGEIDLPMLPVFALFNPVLGVTTVIPPMDPRKPAQADAALLCETLRHHEVTNAFASPTLWRLLAHEADQRRLRFPSLKRALMAGAPVPPWLLRQWHQRYLPSGEAYSPYGATECLPVAMIEAATVIAETGAQTIRGAGTCVGTPLPGTEVKIMAISDRPVDELDPLMELMPGTIGEILVRGPQATAGYYERPDADRLAKVADPHGGPAWHRMGDVGYLDEKGRLWFCGRKAERVVTSGGTVYTDCVEPVFAQSPKVHRCALIGIGKGDRTTPALVIEPTSNHYPRTPGARRAFLGELQALARPVAQARLVTRFFFRRTLPVDIRHNAKIHRLKLARIYRKR